MYAVAVRTRDGLWLLARIRRSAGGDVYFLIPRDDPEWSPHASYHSSGATHVRSYEWKRLATERQKPDRSFKGVATVFSLAIQPGEIDLHRTPCITADF